MQLLRARRLISSLRHRRLIPGRHRTPTSAINIGMSGPAPRRLPGIRDLRIARPGEGLATP